MSLLSAWRWALSRTLGGIFDAFGQFFLALSLAGFTLSIPYFLGTLGWSLSLSAVSVPLVTEITIFTERSAGPKTLTILSERIQHLPAVQTIRVVTKAEALASVNKSLGLKTRQTKTNPLPDLLVATCAKGATSEQIRETATAIGKMKGVDSVAYDDKWARHVGALVSAVSIAAGILGTIVCILVLLVIAASVRLTTLAQRDEIRALHLFGATDTFIKRPYVWRGFLTLGLAALFSIGVTRMGFALLAEPLENFASLYALQIHLTMPDIDYCAAYVLFAAGLGALIGRLAAANALQKETTF